MILIPFVENAFAKWGQLRKVVDQHHLTCDEKQIRFEVRNSIHHALNMILKKSIPVSDLKCAGATKPGVSGKHEINIHPPGQEFIVQLSIQP